MAYRLSLEAIGDDQVARLQGYAQMLQTIAPAQAGAFRAPRRQPWVAHLTGLCSRYGLRRVFLRGQKDYTKANSVGSRGVYCFYTLEEGLLYEVHALLSWQRAERYYCQIRLDQPFRLTYDEVVQCLSAGLESMS
jgi:hypothetical protein